MSQCTPMYIEVQLCALWLRLVQQPFLKHENSDYIEDSVFRISTMTAEPTYREAFDNEPPRDAPGELIDWLKDHANTEITREDQASMNCGIFTDLEDTINYIGEVENINPSRLYVALCVKGRDQCYHISKVNRGDVFTDIEEQVSRGKRSLSSPSKRAIARQAYTLFNDVKSTKFNTDKQTQKISVEYGKKGGIKTSHLNLYWTLTGLKYILKNEPSYMLYQGEPLFEDALIPLNKANINLNERRDMLNAWMAI